MDIVTIQHPKLLSWAAERLATSWRLEDVRVLAGLGESEPVFVVVYSRFYPGACELTLATDGTKRWATKRSLRQIFSLPFVSWGMRRVMFVIRADNEASQDMVRRLGAQLEGRIRQGASDGTDTLIYGMLRTEASRWLNSR